MNRRILRRLLVYTLLSLLGILSLVLAGSGYLLHSESGSRWLAGKLQEWVPGELEIGGFDGRFTGPLLLRDLRYRDAELLVEIRRMRFDWRPTELLKRRLHLVELSLEATRLALPAGGDQPAPAPQFGGFSLPLDMLVETLSIDDFQLLQAEGKEPIILDRLRLEVEASGQQVQVARLEAAAYSAQANLSGELTLSPGLPIALQTAWSYRVTDGPELQGKGSVTGSLQALQVRQSLAAPLSSELNVSLYELEASPRWEADWVLDNTEVGAMLEAFPARISGAVQGKGTFQRLELDGQLDLYEPSLGPLAVEFESRYEQGTVEAKRLLIRGSDGLRLGGQGRYSADAEMGTLVAELDWNHLRWPLTGEQRQFYSQDGQLLLQGRPEDYQYRLDLDVRVPGYPPAQGRLDAEGSGNLQGLILDEFRLVLQEARAEGSGHVAWQPDLDWQLQLTGKDLDPGLFHEAFPGRLSLELTTEGRIKESVPYVELQLKKLQGELRGYPLQAVGAAGFDGKRVAISQFEVDSGVNRLEMQGTLGERLSLDWNLQAPELESLWPGLAGALDARGQLSGKAEMPRVVASVKASRLAYQEQQVADLQAAADLDLDGSQRVEMRLQASKLDLGGQHWDGLRIDLAGLRAAHHLDLQLTGQEVPQLELALEAGLDEQYSWRGVLQSLILQWQDLGQWQLVSAAEFTLDQTQQQIEQACLRSAGADLCGSFSARAETGWQAALQGKNLPISLFQSWLPEETRIAGLANLDAEIATLSGGVWQGRGEIAIPQGKLKFDLGGVPQEVDFSTGLVTVSLDEQAARCALNLPLTGLGGIQGELSLPGMQPMQLDLKNQAISGKLDARIDNLGLLSAISPNLQNLQGAIAADFQLGGTLSVPSLEGDARLQGGAVDLPELGLELRELELSLAASDFDQVQLEGGVRSGKGRLKLSGLTQLDGEKGFPTELRIEGEKWLAVDIPEAEVQVSPDLVIRYTKERSELNGVVHIPYARIRPREMPESAVSGSPDLIVIESDKQAESKQDSRFYSKLRISFGDRVSFEGMGLRGNLTGNLMVTDEPGRPVTGSGRVGVLDGTYRAYGQDLKIERGYALFADSPVDNPGLDVRAVREVEDVTAGLRVTGTLKNPQLSLFSIPAMSESHVLSYLLTGRAPGESGGKSVGVQAALQAAGAGSLASELGRQFGLEELRVETGGAMEEASVVAGTYLSPRLYVQYVNELATGETKLRLRYDLTKKLQIQTESGQSQGVDIFYTIER
ncbi:MAG: translocation/assembly module TamB domain-containing protein [Gammaproteobacteria bacterium]|nr:translocation/assembly module TamB domain-containing protein [Gammaproteobacteria bacterium]